MTGASASVARWRARRKISVLGKGRISRRMVVSGWEGSAPARPTSRVRKPFQTFMLIPPFWCAVHVLWTCDAGRAGAHPYRASALTTSYEQTSVPAVGDRWDYPVWHASSRSSFSRKNSWWGDRFRGKRQIAPGRAGQPADTPQSRRLHRDEPRPPECRPTFFRLLV